MKVSFLPAVTLVLASCSGMDYNLCRCEHENLETGGLVVTVDTIRIANREEAEIECSNFGVTDNEMEAIDCSLE